MTVYLIVRYYPQSCRSEIGVYSTQNLAFIGEQPIDIVIDQESEGDFEAAKEKLLSRLFGLLNNE